MDQNTYQKMIFQAKVTEQAERYEETVKILEDIVKAKKGELTTEERNLLSMAFKNCVSNRRSAWRNIYSFELKERNANNLKYIQLVVDLKKKLEDELTNWSNRMLSLIDNYLLKYSSNDEAKVFYLKLKGDYYRYIAEYATGEQKAKVANSSMNAYKEGFEIAEGLDCTNPIKLGLALNYSVFYYEVMEDPHNATQIATKCFQEGIQKLESIDDDMYKDSTNILQLLKENIDMWSADIEHPEENNEDN